VPNILGQRIDNTGIWVKGSNGNEINLTKADIRARYLLETGSAAARKAKTIAWIQTQIETAIGDHLVPAANVRVDFRDSDGEPLDLELT
jgi:hypothetical protein